MTGISDANLKALVERKRAQAGIPADPPTIGASVAAVMKGLDDGERARRYAEWQIQEAARQEAETTARTQVIREQVEAELRTVRGDLPRALAKVGVPLRLQTATFEVAKDLPPDLVEALRTWVGESGRPPCGFVLLTGPPGCGKSFAAAATVAVGLRGFYRRCEVRWLSEREYLADIRASFDDDGARNRRVLPSNDGRRVQLLILDDLAASRLTDWGRGEMAGLIEARYDEDLPTLITSNLSIDELAVAVDPRVASRIAGDGRIWRLPAKDLRLVGSLSRARTPTDGGDSR
jgi:DNA replication protein DnaC